MRYPILMSIALTLHRCHRYLYIVVLLLSSLFIIDRLFPLPKSMVEGEYAHIVLDRNGVPLRAFADKDGVWRYPISFENVSKNYIEALLEYEDRWFWHHPGINPFSLARALWQNISNDTIVSGGSTLTMQVARLIDPNSRTIPGKLKQIFRSFQLEWHYSKKEILNAYLNRAPFGGVIEGVNAASFTYLGKSAETLSDAEAALLSVLPQAPSRNRPDRYPEKAEKERNKVLKRLLENKVWSAQRVKEARDERVWANYHRRPMDAPLLSRRLVVENPNKLVIRSTIDTNLQNGLEDVVKDRVRTLPSGTSIAVLVVENHNLAVRAYIGSGDFASSERFGHVDMVVATRSPGSTLKPFLYGMAIDEGIVHSSSLLNDTPSSFGDYNPENFGKSYNGPVSLSESLQRSLNVPAVQVLDKLGSNRFLSQLRNSGMYISLPSGAKANLALGLGGAGTNLESLVAAYTSLSNGGFSGQLRYLQDEGLKHHRLLSDGSSWIIRNILYQNRRNDRIGANLIQYPEQMLAWKTGTSYGFRDSWAIGALPGYTIGVWIGRPDGTPLPGYYGAVAAAPILFNISDNLINNFGTTIELSPHYQASMPSSVSQDKICWPLGGRVSETPKSLCHKKLSSFIYDSNVPRTFSDDDLVLNNGVITFLTDSRSGLRVDEHCGSKKTVRHQIALWPKSVEPWIREKWRREKQIPKYDVACKKPPAIATGDLKIAGIHNDSILRPAGASTNMPKIQLHALGGQGDLHWFIDGRLSYILSAAEVRQHQFSEAGKYKITVIDEQGRSDEVVVTVATRLNDN